MYREEEMKSTDMKTFDGRGKGECAEERLVVKEGGGPWNKNKHNYQV
jgi:hypothetical protein